MTNPVHKLLLVILLCSFTYQVSAQFDRNDNGGRGGRTGTLDGDSTRVDSLPENDKIYDNSYSMKRYFLPFEKSADTVFKDSLLDLSKIHQKDFWVWDRADNGGAFSPFYSFTRSEKVRIGPRLGFDRYMSKLREIEVPMYEVSKPITQLYYCMGPKVEQDFMAFHTNNITPRFNFGLKLVKNYAPGFYSGQMNNHSYFKTNTHWRSKNLKWQNENYYSYLKLDFFENGGIDNDTSYKHDDFANLRLFEVPFSDTRLVANQNQSNWRNQHHMSELKTVWRRVYGPTNISYNEDSTQTKFSIKPKAYLEWELSRNRQRFQTVVTDVDSVKLERLGLTGTDALDSLVSDLKYTTVRADMAYAKNFSGTNSNYLLKLGMGYIYARSNGYFDSSQNQNVIIHPQFQWDRGVLKLTADLEFFLLGDYIGDYLLNAKLIAPWNGWEQELDWESYLSSSGSFQNGYRIAGVQRFTDLKAEFGQKLHYEIRKNKLGAVLDFQQINNMIFLSPTTQGMYTYQNLDKGTQVVKLTAGYAHENDRWGYSGKASFLQAASNYPLGVPDWMAQAQVYMNRDVFESRMKLNTGFQIDYLGPYHSSIYSLMANDFSTTNNDIEVNKYNLQYFVNFRISRAKVFVLLSQINQLWQGNYTVGTSIDYAQNQSFRYFGSDNFNLRLGISWLMIN